MEGEALGEIIDALITEHQAELLAAEDAPDARMLSRRHDRRAGAPRAGRRAFAQAALDSPELDARLLVGHALGLDHTGADDRQRPQPRRATTRTRWLRSPRGGSGASRSRASSASRNSGACRCGSTPATLVPRPETETVVEAALAAIDRDGRAPARCASPISAPARARCCSRCFSELPNATGIGTDISREALAAARDNAGRLGLAARAAVRRLRFRRGARRPVRSRGQQSALYRERRHRRACARGARHDPRRALDGGADGLAAYRAIAGQAPRLLRPDGHLVVELGVGQEPAVAALVPRRRACTVARAPRPIRHPACACMRVLPQ